MVAKSTALLVSAALLLAPFSAGAQEQGPKPAVAARTAMASANHPLVTRAMVKVMRKGGNALDAGLVAVAMQPVVEPQMVTLAGGMSILYYDARAGKYHYLDAEVTEQVRADLKSRYGVNVRPTAPYNWHLGSIHAIERRPDGTLLGVADPRRSGLAAGY